MLRHRLQVLIDDERHRRLLAAARERGVSIGALVRDALDAALPASDKRRDAARRILDGPRIPVPGPADLRAELEEIRGGAR
ncbi:MAG: antitoxin [Candidatus Limnocylindria bacterium]